MAGLITTVPTLSLIVRWAPSALSSAPSRPSRNKQTFRMARITYVLMGLHALL